MNKIFFSLLVITIILNVITKENHSMIRRTLESLMDGSSNELFKVWHSLFEKTYHLDNQEGIDRFSIFQDNLKMIKEHNSKNVSFKLGLNQFSDMKNSEFKKKMCTKKIVKGEEFNKLIVKLNAKAVKFLDDYKINDEYEEINHTKFFGDVRNQGSCGSCWTFSVTGAIEGNLAKSKNDIGKYLSPQQLVDCDKGNSGCNGGLFEPAFNYVKENGLEFDDDYNYIAEDQNCNYDQSLSTNTISGYKYCSNYGSEKCSVDIVYNLLVNGPLSIGIDGGTSDFQSYQSGILDTTCSEDNHAVVLAGYGRTDDQKEYWIVRNSWGSSWGEEGYVRVARDDSNNYSCYVNNEAWLPLV